MKICIITGSRAEYFLMKNLILKLQSDKFFKTDLIVTGAHNSNIFGNTISVIKNDRVKISKVIKLPINKDNKTILSKSISLAIEKISNFLIKSKPDLVLLLGDRYEIFASAVASYINKVPIAHIHGGEKTEGSLDEGFRHSITKLSNIHFVSTKDSFTRVKQLGEEHKNIHLVGSLGIEIIKKIIFCTKKEIEKKLKIKLNEKIILVNYHPEPINLKDFKVILRVLKKFKDYTIIFTAPNADIGYRYIINEIKKFTKKNKNSYFFKTLGHRIFFSLCKNISFMIGNSSSGIIELPSFKKPTINVGNRQKSRLRSLSVIDVEYNKIKILNKIKFVESKNFKKKIKFNKNPYDKGNTSKKIISILKKIKMKQLFLKRFTDYKISK